MNTRQTWALLRAALAITVVAVLAACQDDASPDDATLEVTSGREPNASVSGTVTYRERLALTPDARLVVDLRDVSYQDASAPLIARQTILNPGQVPIKFKVEYNRDDIDSNNVYSISARIIEADERLAFINDTAYEVVTRGNSSNVDMVLVLVQPPPDLVSEDEDWRTWVEVPVQVVATNFIPREPEFLRVAYYQSNIDGCARPGSEGLELDGNDILVSVTLMQPPQTAWSIPCGEQIVELDTVLRLPENLVAGQTYRVVVNGSPVKLFSMTREGFPFSAVAESPVERVEVTELEGAPREYQLNVVSGLPKGSSCSQYNGYEIRRAESDTIEVSITHHEVVDPDVICTADYPVVETFVPLGTDFKAGVEYKISVNSKDEVSFVAR